MVIIKHKLLKKEYQRIKPPQFKTRIEELLWLKNEKMNLELINIKYIYISKEDILKMKRSADTNLLYIYDKYKNNTNDYIKIINNDENKKIIHTLLNTEWIIILNNVRKLSLEELEEELNNLEEKIWFLKDKKTPDILNNYLNNSIHLLEYKKESLKNIQKLKREKKKIIIKNKRQN